MDISRLDFKKSNGLIPCIVQDSATRQILMLGYMNEPALQKTIQEKKLTFFSRSKQRLWTKGETSGNYLKLISIDPDCDNDTLLIQAEPAGPVCHTGADTCFGKKNEGNDL
ncbi:MAG TPA: phosphoribosyl-AMP cyclohydrolase, partial [Cyclobacteriaceae bacterium]|nr:phosphoribosyl-AMP cyclohydrolase [Cyclobacteriaceae bacterium]